MFYATVLFFCTVILSLCYQQYLRFKLLHLKYIPQNEQQEFTHQCVSYQRIVVISVTYFISALACHFFLYRCYTVTCGVINVLIFAVIVMMSYLRDRIKFLLSELDVFQVYEKISKEDRNFTADYLLSVFLNKDSFTWWFILYHSLVYFCYSM